MNTRYRNLLATVVLLTAACSELIPGAATTDVELTTIAPVASTVPPTTQTTAAPTLPRAAPTGICSSYEDPLVNGTVTVDEVTEVSGIAVSRSHQDVLWMHNDSGGGPLIYAASLAGEALGSFELNTATFDWEDMSIGPGPEPGRDYLYLGDIGDNFHFRPSIVVHRIAEPVPDPAGGYVAVVDEINLVYPDPGHDSESMFVDPVTGALVIVTKPEAGGEALIYSAPAASLVAGASVDLIQIGSFQLGQGLFVTAADIDSSGALIVFRGYNEVWMWQRTDLGFVETFAEDPCRTPSTAEVQGEAISFSADGYSYYTMSEGREPDINYVFSIFD